MSRDIITDIIGYIIRLAGVLLLLLGLAVAIQVLSIAQDLYQNPENIEPFATVIEQGSNIDKAIASSMPRGKTANTYNGEQTNDKVNVRISYFFAWLINILLLLLIARISLAAVKTGGELALFNLSKQKNKDKADK